MKISEAKKYLVMTVSDGTGPAWIGMYDDPAEATETAIRVAEETNDPDLVVLVDEVKTYQKA